MNELTVLMHLLSKKVSNSQIGATQEEILNSINVKDKNKAIYFQNIINNLSNYLKPLGLQVRFNPLNSYWYISFDSDTTELLSVNPFKGNPRLAATLFCILISCFNSSGETTIQKIKELRKKKGVLDDIKELQKMGFLHHDRNLNRVSLTPLVGYLIDLEKLFLKIALKLKS
ncbi:MAG: hypothetical protein JSV62_12450 [Promethearchaeota archaeon]|nr:MAG: hypothetical protein JSV62_12450 [Candidatus Lokiarchaeota archaeon]